MRKLPEYITIQAGIDPHTHMREPSPVNKAETIASGTRAAAYGGYAGIGDISNTEGRETNSLERLWEKITLGHNDAVIPTGYWFSCQPGEGNIGQIKQVRPWILGGKFFSHPSTGQDKYLGPEDLRDLATELYKVAPDLPIALHAGPDNLEGFIDLAKEIGFHLYIFHMNDPDDVDLATKAIRRGVRITREVSPHHLLMTDEDVKSPSWDARMQPPLAAPADSEKLMWQLMRRRIDTIGTDHAPHTQAAKDTAERENPDGELAGKPKAFGVRSLSVAPSLILSEFIRRKSTLRSFDPFERFEEVISTNPAAAVGIRLSRYTTTTYRTGEYEITPEHDIKLPEAAPTPFIGRTALVKVVRTQIKGKPIFEDGQIVGRHHQLLTKGVIV